MNIFGFRIFERESGPVGRDATQGAERIIDPFQATLGAAVGTDADPFAFNAAGAYAAGGAIGQYYDVDGTFSSEAALVQQYRDMALYPEVDVAIEEIVNEAIASSPLQTQTPVSITFTDESLYDSLKDRIIEEFEYILQLLKFNVFGPDIFRTFYIDGRLYYYVAIDANNPRSGIKRLIYIDPRYLRRVREPSRDNPTGFEQYYIYSRPHGAHASVSGLGGYGADFKITDDSIIAITSGRVNADGTAVLSYLHKAIRAYNQVRTMEDSLVIYRLTRAPERRAFYVDVPAKMPPARQEQYIHDLMMRFKNRVVYNAQTGEIRDDRKYISMLEDFWLPRRSDGKGTNVEILSGGANLGEITDLLYFQRKLYRALHVPPSRFDQDTSGGSFSFGRATEISRDEVRFSKFIDRLRLRFSYLFLNLLEVQLKLKGLVTEEDWDYLQSIITFQWNSDNQFADLKDLEILKERLDVLADANQYVGEYFSKQWINRNVLRLTNEEIEQMQTEIDKEREENNEGAQIADALSAAADDPFNDGDVADVVMDADSDGEDPPILDSPQN